MFSLQNHFSQQTVFSTGLALFLVVGTMVRSGASSIAFLLFLLACFWLYRGSDAIVKLKKSERVWLYSIVLMNVAVLISSYENFSFDLSAIDALTRFLFAIPVYFLVSRIGLNLQILLTGGAVAAIAMGCYAYYQIEILGFNMAVGMTDHNYFGQLALLSTLIAFFGLSYVSNNRERLFFAVASLLGLYAILAASSRGVWIAIPAIVLLVFKYHFLHASSIKKMFFLTIFLMSITVAYLSNVLSLKDRVNTVIAETYHYFVDNQVGGSAGLRLEMWRASLLLIKDNYGLGAGNLGYTKGIDQLLEENKVSQALQRFTVEPHNYYLKTLIGQGIIGIVLLFLIILIPMRSFFHHVRSRSKQVRINALLGISILLAYMDFMLTNTTLDVQLMSVFLAFTLFPLFAHLQFLTRHRQT